MVVIGALLVALALVLTVLLALADPVLLSRIERAEEDKATERERITSGS